MPATDDDLDETRGRNSKVKRLIETYGLQGIGEELERLWTDDRSESRKSLRELATVFNRRLVRSAMEDAGMQLLDGEVENVHRLLTEDHVTGADRMRTRRQLERGGVDVDELQADFVSYQSIRTYLTGCRDASYTKNAESTNSVKETIKQLQSRIAKVTESKLSRLAKRDNIFSGNFRVIVDVRAVCENCGTQTDVITLIDDGGCDCQR